MVHFQVSIKSQESNIIYILSYKVSLDLILKIMNTNLLLQLIDILIPRPFRFSMWWIQWCSILQWRAKHNLHFVIGVRFQIMHCYLSKNFKYNLLKSVADRSPGSPTPVKTSRSLASFTGLPPPPRRTNFWIRYWKIYNFMFHWTNFFIPRQSELFLNLMLFDTSVSILVKTAWQQTWLFHELTINHCVD